MAEVLAGPSGLTRQHLPVPSADDIGKYLKIDANGNPVYYTETPGGTVTEAGANAANDVGAATGATTALKLANLTANASETQEGVAEFATAAEIVTGTDTGRVPNVANLKTSLASDGMWLTKRTKMPDGATAVYAQDAWATADGWDAPSGTLSVAALAGTLRCTGSTISFNKSISGIGGKFLTLRYSASKSMTVSLLKQSSVTLSTFSANASYNVATFLIPTDATLVRFYAAGLAEIDWFAIDWIWIGDYSYLTGTLSEEAARIADQLGDSAGVGVAASGILSGTNPDVGDTIVIGGKPYTWRATIDGSSVEGDVLRGSVASASWIYLSYAINYSTGYGTYHKCSAKHGLVEILWPTYPSGSPTIAARNPGELGNLITVTTDAPTRITLSGSTLTGGYSDAAAKIITAVGNNIAGGGTRPAAAKVELTNTALIGYETTVDVAKDGTTTLPAGGAWIWNVYGYGATVSSAKRGSSAGGTTLTVAGANASVGYRRYA